MEQKRGDKKTIYNELYSSSPNDIEHLTKSIKAYDHELQTIGQSKIPKAWKIGFHLCYVKEYLEYGKHGKFMPWVEKNFSFTHKQINKYMKFFKEFPNYSTSSNLFPTWSHAELVIYLPKEVDKHKFLIQDHTIPSSGVVKTFQEMSVRELTDVVKQFKKRKQKQNDDITQNFQEPEDRINMIIDELDYLIKQNPFTDLDFELLELFEIQLQVMTEIIQKTKGGVGQKDNVVQLRQLVN